MSATPKILSVEAVEELVRQLKRAAEIKIAALSLARAVFHADTIGVVGDSMQGLAHDVLKLAGEKP